MMHALKKWTALFLALALVPWAALAEGTEAPADPAATAAHTAEACTYPFSFSPGDDKEPVVSEMTLYFIDGGTIPYMPISQYLAFLSDQLKAHRDWDEVNYTFRMATEADGTESYLIEREDNDGFMFIVPALGLISFNDFNLFTIKPGISSLVNILDLPSPEDVDLLKVWNEAKLGGMSDESQLLGAMTAQQAEQSGFFVSAGRLFNRGGSWVDLNLGSYDIEIYSIGGECYLPFQTLNDIFMNSNYMLFIFNGNEVLGQVHGGKYLDRAFEAEPREMDMDMTLFNYSELLFLLDTFYGLKAEHGIEDFGTMIMRNRDLVFGFLSSDAGDFDTALATLTQGYLDDKHSGYRRGSWYAGNDVMNDLIRQASLMGYSMMTSTTVDKKFSDARAAAYPDGCPGYEEVGDTAFITFDSFTAEAEDHDDYYDIGIPASLEECTDTVRLILYAHAQVTREDSPIQNVVIDLSNNHGGNTAAAVTVTCWFLGTASFALRDTMTNAMTITGYKTDLNLNRETASDPGDSLKDSGLGLYCLTSPVSFSCGNLVPAAFKAANTVTLIGQCSGGGSCAVLPCTSASGAMFQISGTKQLAVNKNGTFYNIDNGIEPDIVLTKPASFYDREALVELIHNAK